MNPFRRSKSTKRKARLKRLPASPKALGLVSFSLAGLCLGSAVYVAAIPGLVAQSPAASVVRETGEQAVEGAIAAIEGASDAAIKGLEVASVSTVTAATSDAASPSDASNASSDAEAPSKASENENKETTSDTNKKNDQNSDSGNTEPEPEPEPGLDQATEAKWRTYYVGTYNNLTSMVETYNSCVSDLNVKRYASYSQRSAALSKCEALQDDLLSGYLKVVNSGIPHESKYYRFRDPQIISHRALAGALDSIIEAWNINLAYGDEGDGPRGHEDEFMKPLLDDQVDGENKYITEFKQYYASGRPSDG